MFPMVQAVFGLTCPRKIFRDRHFLLSTSAVAFLKKMYWHTFVSNTYLELPDLKERLEVTFNMRAKDGNVYRTVNTLQVNGLIRRI